MLREEEKGRLLHRGILRVSLPLIRELIELPEEYITHGVYIDPVRGLLCFVLEHPSLPLIEEGYPAPRLEPLYRRLEGCCEPTGPVEGEA